MVDHLNPLGMLRCSGQCLAFWSAGWNWSICKLETKHSNVVKAYLMSKFELGLGDTMFKRKLLLLVLEFGPGIGVKLTLTVPSPPFSTECDRASAASGILQSETSDETGL